MHDILWDNFEDGDIIVMKHTEEQVKPNRFKVFLLFVVALSFCTIFAAGFDGETGISVGGENAELRLFGKYGSQLIMVFEDTDGLTAYYKDISDTNSQLTGVTVAESGRDVFMDGMVLGITGDFESDCFKAKVYDLEKNFEDFDWCPYEYYPNESDRLAFGRASEEDIYTMYILSEDEKLQYCESFGELEDTGLSEVKFLGSTRGGWIYTYSEGCLLRWMGADIEKKEVVAFDTPCPKKLVGEEAYIDENDALVRIRDGVLETVILDDNNSFQTYFATENNLIAVDTSNVIHKFDWSGEEVTEIEVAQADGDVLGFIDNYALVARDDGINFNEVKFHDPEDNSDEQGEPTPVPDEPEEPEQPTPEPTGSEVEPTATPEPEISEPEADPEPTDTPEPTDPDDDITSEPEEPTTTPPPIGENDEVGKIISEYQFKQITGEQGEYVYILTESRVSDLRKIYSPQSIEMYTKEGNKVYEGILKTGMKMCIPTANEGTKEVTVVIKGDCDGDGYVRKSDIVVASLYVVNATYLETEAQFIALDMNQDGEITLWDLPPIADEIARTTFGEVIY